MKMLDGATEQARGEALAPRGVDPVVADLNAIYAELVESAVRYLQLLTTTKGLDRLLIRQVLSEGLNRTIQHIQEVGEKIAQLGGMPCLDLHLSIPGARCSGTDAIRTALAFEQGVLDGYRDLEERASGNLVLDEFCQRQIARQSERVSKFYMLLES